jgi:hypothetical protein
MTRKEIYFENRWWKRVEGGMLCDNCNRFIVGFLQAYKNKKTLRILCGECYLSGK